MCKPSETYAIRTKIQRVLSLHHQEIDALRQFVERVEALDPAKREFVARVTLLTRFVRDLLGES